MEIKDISDNFYSKCQICHSDHFEPSGENGRYQTLCGHIFHTKCIENWHKTQLSCPSCTNYNTVTKIVPLKTEIVPLETKIVPLETKILPLETKIVPLETTVSSSKNKYPLNVPNLLQRAICNHDNEDFLDNFIYTDESFIKGLEIVNIFINNYRPHSNKVLNLNRIDSIVSNIKDIIHDI
tara:strand:+ start:55 stop:597 length:543 start_codon:yes stop_codon:yes gene_type:complete